MHINDSILLNYIKEEAEFLLENATKYSYSEFISNPVLKRAFARSIEIIGEASKKLSKVLIAISIHPKLCLTMINDYFT